MTSVMSGMVESKSRNEKSIKVNGEWYGAFRAETLKDVAWKDTVEFEFEKKGEYNNIKGNVKKIAAGAVSPEGSTKPAGKSGYRANGEAGGFPLHPLSYERALDRRNALQVAGRLTAEMAVGNLELGELADQVIELARRFEAYSTGDEERVMAEKMFKESEE